MTSYHRDSVSTFDMGVAYLRRISCISVRGTKQVRILAWEVVDISLSAAIPSSKAIQEQAFVGNAVPYECENPLRFAAISNNDALQNLMTVALVRRNTQICI
jgi:hypothetical protein